MTRFAQLSAAAMLCLAAPATATAAASDGAAPAAPGAASDGRFAIPAPDPSRLAAPDGPLVRRGTLLVADMEKSLAFWVGVLGFVVHSDSVSGPTSYSYPVFRIPQGARIRFVTLSDRREHRMMAIE
ncbi:MAG: hypothetical protein ACK40H_00810, partial [Sphingomonadaceae bacterium]